jgi:His/Glu/Gln/Arg/opine family amino acid ABC transporter permease subunit
LKDVRRGLEYEIDLEAIVRFNVEFLIDTFMNVIEKFDVNFSIACYAFSLSLVFGIIINLIYAYKCTILVPVINAYISLARAIPIYLQIVLFFFGIPVILRTFSQSFGMDFNVRSVPPMFSVIVALTFNMTAYISEALRGGVSGIPKGEIEAAFSLGMTVTQILRRVILPQAIALSLPSLCVLLIGLTHSTTLAFGATIIEMNGQASIQADGNGLYFEAFLAAGMLFWCMTVLIGFFFRAIERRIKGKFDPNMANHFALSYA